MKFSAIFLLAVGLAMDATAVAAARGMAVSRLRPRHVILIALFFGGSQAIMPLVGWLVGSRIGPWVEAWDHWIAFALLSGIGGKMIWEALKGGADDDAAAASDEAVDKRDRELFELRVLSVLAIATSIDALAVGVTLPMLDAPLLLSIATIGVTTAVLSALGLFAGRRFGAVLGQRLDVFGGVVLVGLGIKILFEHLHAG